MTVPPVEINLRYILVRGWYKQIDGITPETGYLEFTPSTPLSHPYTGIIRMDTTRIDLDEHGKFEISLLCTDIGGMIPTGWMWFFEEKIKNGNSGYFELIASMPNPVDFATMVVIPPTEPPSHGVPGTVGIGPMMITGQTTTVPYGVPAALTIEMVGPNTFEVDAALPQGKDGVSGSGELYVQPEEPVPPTGLLEATFWVDTDDPDAVSDGADGEQGPPGPPSYVVQPSQPEYIHDLLWLDSDEVWEVETEETSFTRTTVSKTTASLAAGAAEQSTVTLANAYRLYKITTSAPCRVRLYTTTGKQSADLARAIGTDPTGDHGCILEFVSAASLLSADLSPLVDGFDGKDTPDGVIPITITNTGTGSAAVTVTLVWVRTE